MDHISEMAAFGRHTETAESEQASPVQKQLLAAKKGINALFQSFIGKVESVRASSHFTEEGLLARIGELAEYELKRLSIYEQIVAVAEDRVAEMQALAVGDAEEFDLHQALKHTEVRNYLLSLSEEARMEVIEVAFAENDSVVINAVLDAPRVLDVVPFKEYLESLRARVAEHKNPELAAKVAETNDILEHTLLALNNARVEIYKEAGLDINRLEDLWYEDEPEATMEEDVNSGSGGDLSLENEGNVGLDSLLPGEEEVDTDQPDVQFQANVDNSTPTAQMDAGNLDISGSAPSDNSKTAVPGP